MAWFTASVDLDFRWPDAVTGWPIVAKAGEAFWVPDKACMPTTWPELNFPQGAFLEPRDLAREALPPKPWSWCVTVPNLRYNPALPPSEDYIGPGCFADEFEAEFAPQITTPPVQAPWPDPTLFPDPGPPPAFDAADPGATVWMAAWRAHRPSPVQPPDEFRTRIPGLTRL